MTNPKTRVIESILGIEHKDCDFFTLSYYNGKFSGLYIDAVDGEEETIEELIKLGDVPSIVALNYCTGQDFINDLEGTQFIYNSRTHRKVLGFSIIIPLCIGTITYNDGIESIDFSEIMENNLRKSFKVI